MPWVMLAEAALGAASKKQEQDQKIRQNAINTRFGPWTNEHPEAVTEGALQGATAGAGAGLAQGQKMGGANSWKWLLGGQQPAQQNTVPAMSGWGPVASGGLGG